MAGVTALLLALLVAGPLCQAQNKSKADLEKEKSRIEAEIKKLNKELASAKKNTRMTTAQLNALNKKIKERTRLIANINQQVTLIDGRLQQTKDSMQVMTLRIDSMKAEYAKIVRVLYRERDNLDKMALLFDTKSYNRSFLRIKYFKAYSSYRRLQANRIRQRESELQDMALLLQKQKREKSELLQQEQRNKAELDKERQQKSKAVASAKAKENKISTQLSQKEKQKRQLQQQIQRLINEEVQRAAASKGGATGGTGKSGSSGVTTPKLSEAEVALSSEFSENKGRFAWPVYYKSIAREYGLYVHASGGQNMNNGIEFICNQGSAVFCIFNGTVTRVFTCPNGTKGIIVRHGEYMTVYANLGTVAVKQGAKVTTKQTLGTVAVNGDGVAEFSFQLWKGTQSQNPRHWLRK
ncbi:MAG: peptidoglycan DD-metalloendopeptidase family protein [Bacteroidales bacterium]|nr:peptidoglycan DD-metalloendopeptidase family protein [Bacteroidales bacterium]